MLKILLQFFGEVETVAEKVQVHLVTNWAALSGRPLVQNGIKVFLPFQAALSHMILPALQGECGLGAVGRGSAEWVLFFPYGWYTSNLGTP